MSPAAPRSRSGSQHYPGGVSAVDALFWVACLVLAVAGATKVVDPSEVATTLSALGLGGRSAARLLGSVELVVAVAALAVGGRVAAAIVAVAYVAFAGIVLFARRRGLRSCGCFGARSAPPSLVHVVVDVASAAVALAAMATTDVGPPPVADGLGGFGWAGVVVAGLVLLATILVVVVDTMVAELVEATRLLREQGDHDRAAQPVAEGT